MCVCVCCNDAINETAHKKNEWSLMKEDSLFTTTVAY